MSQHKNTTCEAEEGEGEGEGEGEAEAPIHGDMLEAIFSHVPLIDLLSASHVSTSWNDAVSSSLTHLNPIKPFLILHSHSSNSTHAYDPRSHLWLHIPRRPINLPSAVRSSHPSLLYVLSPTTFSFSFDPLNLTWHHAADAPRIWRVDPVVARVGRHVIVAGGSCDFEDNPLAVELYDLDTRSWRFGPSMPEILKDSTANTWLSVAVDERRMLVTEKSSGITYSFDPYGEIWCGPYDLKADVSVYSCVVGIVRERVVVLGLIGEMEELKGVRLWELGDEDMGLLVEIGEIPREMVEKVKGESECVASIGMNAIGDLVYVYNPSDMAEIVVGEIVGGRMCKWRSVENVVMKEIGLQRMVIGCGDVAFGDLQKAVSDSPSKFTSETQEENNYSLRS